MPLSWEEWAVSVESIFDETATNIAEAVEELGPALIMTWAALLFTTVLLIRLARWKKKIEKN